LAAATNNQAGGAKAVPAVKGNPVPQPAGKKAESANPSPTNTTSFTGTGDSNATQGTTPSPEPAGQIGFWTIFWPVLILGVFLWMWRSGKLLAIKVYIGEVREQLRKATWPTWDELKQHIVVVMISSLLLAMFTVLADNVVKEIVWGALLGSDTILFDPPAAQ